MDRGSLGAVHVPPTFVRSTTVYLTIPPPGAHRQPYLQAHGVLSLTAWPTYCLIILPHRRLDRKSLIRIIYLHKYIHLEPCVLISFYHPYSFIDALFNCVSAMTVTGLATIDLSQLTGFQQSILFVLMCIGNPVIISWFIVYTRRRFFRNKLSHIIAEELKRERQGGIIAAMRERTMSISRSLSRDHQAQAGGASPTDIHGKHYSRPGLLGRFANWAFPAASPGKSPSSTMSGAATPSSDRTKRKTGLAQRLRTDMIRRTEAEPQRVDPMGGIGGLMVDDIGGKGKARELSGQQFPEKGDQFNHGGEVHHVITGSSGSQTRYGGDNSSNPSLHRTNSLRSTEAERMADDDTSLAQTLAMPSRHSNGTIPTPHRPEYDMAPNPANLSPPVTDELHLGPLMGSPSHIDDRDGILLHPDADRNMDIIEGDSEGLDRATSADRSHSRGRPTSEARDSDSRTRVSSSPVRFRPPPIRVNPSTIGEERLSPSQGREADLMSVSFSGHERHPSEAVTQREPGTGIGEFPRNQTIEFVNTPHVRGRATARRQSAGVNSERERARFRNFSLGGSSNAAPAGSDAEDTSSANIGVGTSSIGHGNYGRGRASRQRMGSVSTAYFPRTATGRSHGTTRMNPSAQLPSHQSGYGGFPMPHELIGQGIKRFFPRTMTITRTLTMGSGGGEPRQVPYITFDAVVGRNSQFHDLTQEEQEELGGVEYRALGALLWIVPVYHFGIQLFGFVVFAPYSSMSKWAPIFREQQHRYVPPTCEATVTYGKILANFVSTFKARGKLSPNHPQFKSSLRFFIWLLSKVVGKRTHETLSFLLDHPRRCFIYLFPSHQTWFLLIVLVTMVLTDWISFMVLDIGNDVFESIPVGTRIALGLLQAGAVRAAGFASVSISALAPAVKYVAVYPIALSVRATNVYEEQSLGIYLDGDEEEPNNPSNAYSWGSYLAWHARRQLSFGPSILQPFTFRAQLIILPTQLLDMWWLAVALWLLCIIERAEIMNPNSEHWFDIFTIIFELVSAYGTVGLSLGLPTVRMINERAVPFGLVTAPIACFQLTLIVLVVVLPWELMGRQGQNRSFNGLDTLGNRQSMTAEPGSFEGHSTSRAPTTAHGGVDLKHRGNTILSPVREVLTPVTSVTGTPRATFSALGSGGN
ncbi:potassium ion transporter (Trk1), putative [Rhizoctonia solani AG-1 IA]|uniref:Potassium ion transporter (Trk1), putative n=1 Tax=Thanatephorus cucumeris (strain AG1-IA) TaxID=983506 RepID=L8WS18_THACA|nr:potassium ion transporter (Trk1), putative [Rhizoctonia solani AG-1 IA]